MDNRLKPEVNVLKIEREFERYISKTKITRSQPQSKKSPNMREKKTRNEYDIGPVTQHRVKVPVNAFKRDRVTS